MIASRFKILSIAVLVIFLVSLVEPKESSNCPTLTEAETKEKKETFIVMLNKNDMNAVKDHYKMMRECMSMSFQTVKPNSQMKALGSNKNENIAMDFSVDGVILGYTGKFTKSFAKKLADMSCVKLVEKDAEVKTNYVIPETLQKRAEDDKPPKNLDRIDQAKGFDGKFVFPDTAGKGVNIFVVDTGIRTTHNEFEGRAKFGAAFCDGCNDQDENGHGTQVASVAAGKSFGVARKANLIAVRVLDAKGSGSNAVVINGLSFVGDQHKKAKNKNSVVNMSLGGGFSDAVNSAVKDLTDAGIHVAVAAGNEAADACKSSPSSEPSAVTVGATELNTDDITDFSNVGKCVKIFAPGRDIIGAGIKSDKDTVLLSGTSQATPHVAGTLALIISKQGNQAPAAMSKTLDDLSTKGVVKGDLKSSADRFLRVPAP